MDRLRSTVPPPKPCGHDSIANRIATEVSAVHVALANELVREKKLLVSIERLLYPRR
jgi:hypothetical protein